MKEIFELRRMNFWQTKRQTSITVWQKLKKLKKNIFEAFEKQNPEPSTKIILHSFF